MTPTIKINLGNVSNGKIPLVLRSFLLRHEYKQYFDLVMQLNEPFRVENILFNCLTSQLKWYNTSNSQLKNVDFYKKYIRSL